MKEEGTVAIAEEEKGMFRPLDDPEITATVFGLDNATVDIKVTAVKDEDTGTTTEEEEIITGVLEKTGMIDNLVGDRVGEVG